MDMILVHCQDNIPKTAEGGAATNNQTFSEDATLLNISLYYKYDKDPKPAKKETLHVKRAFLFAGCNIAYDLQCNNLFIALFWL